MGLFDMLDPDERRARKEAKAEARDYRNEAKNTLSDEKDVYDDYKELKKDAQRVANELNDFIRSYNKYKADLLKELSGNISVSIANFKNFNISSRVSVPNIRTGSAPNIPTVTVSSIISSIPGYNFSPIGIALSVFSDPYKDRDEAMEQMEAAQEYLYKVQCAKADMEILLSALRDSKTYVSSEKEVVTELMGKVRKIVSRLNDAMNRNSFTEQEASSMTAISKIAEKIKETLEQRVVSNSGNIEGNYKLYSDRLRKINDKIPAAPTISESSASTWIDDIIVY